jgi:hypothetical protein
MEKNNYEKECNRMIADIKSYPGPETGEYKNVKYHLERPHGTNWCGYICIPYDELPEKSQKKIENKCHCEFTGGYTNGDDKYIGFDTMHYCDFFTMDKNSAGLISFKKK